MSHYRDLNKELVEQVQTMRKNMKLYCDEIVYLKGELLQKHETEVILRAECYNWAINSFVHLMQTVQPDSEILPVLVDHINARERRLSCNSTERRQPWPARRSDTRRRSSLITREFQRSNSVINLRKSVCSTSPIRGSSTETSEGEEEQNFLPNPSDAEATGDDAAQNEIPQNGNVEKVIYEESEEEEEEEIYNCEDMDIESVYESVEEVSVDISENRATLNNITNILKSTKISSKNIQDESVKKRVQPKRTKKKNLRGKENLSDEYATSKEDSDNDIAKRPNKLRESKNAENSSKVIDEETVQEPRRCSDSRPNFDINSKSFPLHQNHGQISNNEATMNSTTLILNDITLRNFQDAACSTPNSRQNSLDATAATKCDTAQNLQTSTNTSNRPSRHCKPKSLAEPRLGTKLRNESETKTLRKSACKPKSKIKAKK